jgi:hypothetical protein
MAHVPAFSHRRDGDEKNHRNPISKSRRTIFHLGCFTQGSLAGASRSIFPEQKTSNPINPSYSRNPENALRKVSARAWLIQFRRLYVRSKYLLYSRIKAACDQYIIRELIGPSVHALPARCLQSKFPCVPHEGYREDRGKYTQS